MTLFEILFLILKIYILMDIILIIRHKKNKSRMNVIKMIEYRASIIWKKALCGFCVSCALCVRVCVRETLSKYYILPLTFGIHSI